MLNRVEELERHRMYNEETKHRIDNTALEYGIIF